jgi:hypothetical protein
MKTQPLTFPSEETLSALGGQDRLVEESSDLIDIVEPDVLVVPARVGVDVDPDNLLLAGQAIKGLRRLRKGIGDIAARVGCGRERSSPWRRF